jgi:hypothetical protein
MRYILFTFILLVSCKTNSPIDETFKEKFNREIYKLEYLKLNGLSEEYSSDSIQISAELLKNLTGHYPTLEHNYTILYSYSNFTKDTSIWKKWYEKNKYKVNDIDFQKARDKAFEKFYQNKTDSNSIWPK